MSVDLTSAALEAVELANDSTYGLSAAVFGQDVEQAKAAYNSAVPVIDRMADKGIIHKNKASRHKSRLNAQVKAMAA